MNPGNIVSGFNILEYRKFSLFECSEASLINMLDFQGFEKAFSYCIIPAITLVKAPQKQ